MALMLRDHLIKINFNFSKPFIILYILIISFGCHLLVWRILSHEIIFL